LCICENEATIEYHHGSALKLRNTCRRSLTQRLVSWSSPVVPKVWVETPKKGEGSKNGWRRGDPNLRCVYSTLLLRPSVAEALEKRVES